MQMPKSHPNQEFLAWYKLTLVIIVESCRAFFCRLKSSLMLWAIISNNESIYTTLWICMRILQCHNHATSNWPRNVILPICNCESTNIGVSRLISKHPITIIYKKHKQTKFGRQL